MYKDTIPSLIFKPVTERLPEVLGSPRERQEILDEIRQDTFAYYQFQMLSKTEQEVMLDFCMGNRSLQITYDPFFLHIFNPLRDPERLNRLLSCILEQNVKVKAVLPREGERLAAEASLVIMDILVELEDGTLTSVEMQKQGYDFTPDRASCYGADLLMRQYDRIRNAMKDKFSYRDIKPVYIIVLMEKSWSEFRKYSDTYIHRSEMHFSSGMEIKNLINYVYIPLDIFMKMPHNELTELEAWLYFLGSDNPVDIQRIIIKYPFFRELYQDIIDFRYHPEELISMYSKILSILDTNTLNLIVDELREEIAKKDATISEKGAVIAEKDAELSAALIEIERLKEELAKQS